MEKPQIEDILPVEVTNFPESEKVSGLLEDLIKKIEALDLVVNVKEQKIDIQEIVKAIKEIQIPEGKDYTNELQAIGLQLEKLNEEDSKKDSKDEEKRRKEKLSILQGIYQAIKEVNTTQDFSPIIAWLQAIAEKEETVYPFTFIDGRVLVEVDRVSGGSGGLNKSESEALISIPEKLEDPLTPYKITDKDDDASPNYFGFTKKDGSWYIMKETVSAGADTYRYVAGTEDYTTNWTNRASLSYDYFYATF
jgi:virulence-associated protein VapD